MSHQWSRVPLDTYTHRCANANGDVMYGSFADRPVDVPSGSLASCRFLDDFRGRLVTRINIGEQKRIVQHPYARKNGALWSALRACELSSQALAPSRLTMFNGACFKFDYQFWSEIKRVRRADIVAGYPLFDNEIALSGEGIRFFVEVDYRLNVDQVQSELDIPTSAQLLRDGLAIQRAVHSLGLFPDCRCILLDCHMKMKTDRVIAIGLHAVFTNIVVDSATGVKLCQAVQKATQLEVDSVPYKTSSASLRPAFSRKVGDCPDCFGSVELMRDCHTCSGQGKVGMGSYYIPRKVIAHDGTVQDYQGEDTSIIPPRAGTFSVFK